MSKTYVVVGHSRELMIYDKQKLYEIGGVRPDEIKKWADENKGPSQRSQLDGDILAKGGAVPEAH